MRITDDEIFDVVDACDNVIGQASRAEVHRKGLFHRAIHVFVFNAEEEIFLQRRSLVKDVAPGLWSSSCSGHVDSGETYEEAAHRELVEEIFLFVHSGQLDWTLMASPCSATENEFVRLYRCRVSQSLKTDPLEIMDSCWMNRTELDRWMRREPEAFSPSFLHLYALECLLAPLGPT